MTLFKRSEGTLAELNKVLASLETDTGSEIADKKRRLDQMTEMVEILGQNCCKLRKAAQESDPTKVGYTCTCDPECKANTNMHLLFCTNKCEPLPRPTHLNSGCVISKLKYRGQYIRITASMSVNPHTHSERMASR